MVVDGVLFCQKSKIIRRFKGNWALLASKTLKVEPLIFWVAAILVCGH